MPSLYKMSYEPEVADVLEEMRKKVASQFGVTLVGNRLTLRWTKDGQTVSVHAIIAEVVTPAEQKNAD
jgi:hypothetical protein